jgi:hypothetical protein
LEVATKLAKQTDLSIFITGISAPALPDAPPRNRVMSYLFSGKRHLARWEQSKHHRWRIEETQTRNYGFSLPPKTYWWEDIDVANREVIFYCFHPAATMATLVCEDLARIDPVQPVMRAVGPNLVIALLMDGPQYEWRWPGRYATVLADDPGSSVLTLTSVATVDRYLRNASAPGSRVVALWKDARGRAQELSLEADHHALLLEARIRSVEERTMDRRSDGGVTAQLTLQSCASIRHPTPPRWVTGASPRP